MLIQGLSIPFLLLFDSFQGLAFPLAALGLGTAVVYPTFLAGISENTHPSQRPKAIGTFRFWRDLSYIFGALLSGCFVTNGLSPLPWLALGGALLPLDYGLVSE